MKKPTITINGRTMTPKRNPTMKMWRIITKQDEVDDAENMTMSEIFDSRLDIIATVYEVDKAELDDMPVDRIIPAYKDIVKWINELIFPKIAQIPNSEAGKKDTTK